MKSVFVFLMLLSPIASAQTWAEKYTPTSPLKFECKVTDWMGEEMPFTLIFEDADYSGHNGGYFYTKISRIAPEALSSGQLKEFPLLHRSHFHTGEYVFEDGFQLKIESAQPFDGNADNNLYLSDYLAATIHRGSGSCTKIH